MGLTLDTETYSSMTTWASSYEYLKPYYKIEEGQNENNNSLNENQNLILYTFEYRKYAGSVLLTGTFCNWSYNYYLTLTKNNIFSITIEIPEGINEFKFIVDGKEKIDDFYPIKLDNNGNKINYILAKNEIEKENIKKKNDKKNNNGYSNNINDNISEKLGRTEKVHSYFKEHLIINKNDNNSLLYGLYIPNIYLNHLERPQNFKTFNKLSCKVRINSKVVNFIYYNTSKKTMKN